MRALRAGAVILGLPIFKFEYQFFASATVSQA
jgi:hypothetical protein